MSRESAVFLFGILIFFLPHLGIPSAWKMYFYSASGIFLIIIGYSLRRRSYLRSIAQYDGERKTDSFAESVVSEKEMQT